MGERALDTYTYEEYLALEQEGGIKLEFYDGLILAMAGGTPRHSLLAANAGRFIANALDKNGRPCQVFNSDLKVHIELLRKAFYPDVKVVCGAPLFSALDPQALVNPLLIVEVLSPHTASFDRGAKFHAYRSLPSLREYFLISQDEPALGIYFRSEAGLWDIKQYEGAEGKLFLQSLDCEIDMQDLYRLADWEGLP
jgi:Uma2 family endonuclease